MAFLDDGITRRRRNLPHWEKAEAVFWVTFRLADALPQSKLTTLRRKRDAWIKAHPQPWDAAVWAEYAEHFGDQIEAWLDAGMGSCALADPTVREVVRNCLLRFEGEHLRLHGAVIMPNHVHALIEPLGGESLARLLKGIKGASARQANAILGRTGEPFWMDESFDHIVRSRVQYVRFQLYIRENPIKARLDPGSFWVYPETAAE